MIHLLMGCGVSKCKLNMGITISFDSHYFPWIKCYRSARKLVNAYNRLDLFMGDAF